MEVTIQPAAASDASATQTVRQQSVQSAFAELFDSARAGIEMAPSDKPAARERKSRDGSNDEDDAASSTAPASAIDAAAVMMPVIAVPVPPAAEPITLPNCDKATGQISGTPSSAAEARAVTSEATPDAKADYSRSPGSIAPEFTGASLDADMTNAPAAVATERQSDATQRLSPAVSTRNDQAAPATSAPISTRETVRHATGGPRDTRLQASPANAGQSDPMPSGITVVAEAVPVQHEMQAAAGKPYVSASGSRTQSDDTSAGASYNAEVVVSVATRPDAQVVGAPQGPANLSASVTEGTTDPTASAISSTPLIGGALLPEGPAPRQAINVCANPDEAEDDTAGVPPVTSTSARVVDPQQPAQLVADKSTFSKSASALKASAPVRAGVSLIGGKPTAKAKSTTAHGEAESRQGNEVQPVKTETSGDASRASQSAPKDMPVVAAETPAPPVQAKHTEVPARVAASETGQAVRSAPTKADAQPKNVPVAANDMAAAEPATRTAVAAYDALSVSRLLQRARTTDLRLGVRSEKFGEITVEAIVHENRLGTTVRIDQPRLESFLTAEIGRLESGLAGHRIELANVNVMAGGGGGGDQRGETHSGRQSAPAATLREQAKISSSDVIRPAAVATHAGQISILA